MGAERFESPHAEVLALIEARVGPEWLEDDVDLLTTELGRPVVSRRRVTYWTEEGELFASQVRPDRVETAHIHADGSLQLISTLPIADPGMN